jgi:hypothetical protein
MQRLRAVKSSPLSDRNKLEECQNHLRMVGGEGLEPPTLSV